MRVLVCGAGIAGLGLASFLRQRGHTAMVIEKSRALRTGGYMIDFFGSGYEAAERLGMLPELEKIHYAVDRLVVVDARGRERASVEYPPVRRRFFGGRHFNFLRGDLERLLHGRIKGSVPLRLGVTVESFDETPGAVRVVLSDGTTEEVDVLVGADGVHSHVRRLAFGAEPRFERSLGFWAAAFVLDRVPDGLPPVNAFFALNVPQRQVAVYPVRGGRLAALFVQRIPSGATQHPDKLPLDEFRSRYSDLGWIVPHLLELSCGTPDLYCDWASQVELPRWSRGRVTLVGDACQCVSFLAGEGASLALAGACVLAEELDRTPHDIPKALARYERRMKPWAAKKQAAGRRNADWLVPATQPRLAFRDFMLRASSTPFVASLVAPFVRRSLLAGSPLA